MGCGISRKQQIKVNKLKQSEVKHPSVNNKNNIKENKANLISESSWIKVIDYLSFNELKQSAKVNRMFNYISKQHDILIKFFKKRKQNEFIPSVQLSNSSLSTNVYNEIPPKEIYYIPKIPTFTIIPIKVN